MPSQRISITPTLASFTEQNTIRSLVEHQILPNFTSIFLQAEEGGGPGGTALDNWLEGLLAEMQASIERHLKHVFQGTTASQA